MIFAFSHLNVYHIKMNIKNGLSLFISIFIIVLFDGSTAVANSITSEPREAYFNGSGYLRLLTPMPVWGHSALSIRTCRGGEILSQRHNGHILLFSIHSDSVTLSLVSPSGSVEARVPARLLDNKWHTIQFLFQLGNLNLIIDKQSTLIANSTYNSLFLTSQEIKNEAAVSILGSSYTGCLLHGPGLLFNTSTMNSHLVLFGECPLAPGPCAAHDVLIRVPTDHCQADPCMRHGVCISRSDSYECHCAPRYSGKNCEVDTGPPCQSEPCKNGGTCLDENRGDYKCICTSGYTGSHCETEISIHPLCINNPCMNNGTCKVLSTADGKFECDCLKGFIGSRCEIDRNDCESQPCLNGGICIDEIGTFKCNCSGIGYSGTLCQNNIDECIISGPCLNGGICYDTYGSYTCECTPGFGGNNCEQQINECFSQPCRQGGTCIDQKGGRYECNCPPGYSGINCEKGIPCTRECPHDFECLAGICVCKTDATGACKTNNYNNNNKNKNATQKLAQNNACNCLNGATCFGNASNFSCICSYGFTGLRCESPLALQLEDCPCQNGGSCTGNGDGGIENNSSQLCKCPKGFDGIHCERLEPCSSSNCHEPMTCFGGSCICPDTNANCLSGCISTPCLNGATCHNTGIDYYCQCTSGYNGTNCESDINECNGVGVCGHGICVNQPGTYKCYCEPGFTGLLCDLDVDECLSHPCKNNATCVNKINDYQCVCPPGYNGKDCSTDIDECASNPCSHGSTCNNLVANFSCVCIVGMTGRYCEIDIDDCESQPCQHGGQCKDELGSFTCNCTSTGYQGIYCQMNIDECLSSPCANEGECVDKINDYQCSCNIGYFGKNCEIDIDECESQPCQYNGRCLQRSNITLYTSAERYQLPVIFHQSFSYENASGYECICVPGIIGKNCEINVNECDSNPCQHGNCVDGVGSYTCECEPGYEGELCETEIDECEKFQPCVHGKCHDRIATYTCKCEAKWGGKNCSVELTGCINSPCKNNGTCSPSLENETIHSFNCTCPEGYQGNTCEKETTLSLIEKSILTVNTSRTEGYDIHLRFRTTLPNGILVFGNGNIYSYILELVNGRLNLHSSLLNKWEGVFIGSALNNSEWHKVFVSINSTHLLLSANEETTIYPITSYDINTSNVGYTTFPVTYLGGTIPHLSSYLRHLTHAPSSFVGCMQDVVINGQWIFPHEINPNQSLISIESGCPRTSQCEPNPCHSNGQCIDLWHKFSCACQRPHLGHICQYNITAATFGHENTTQSAVVVDVADYARRTIRSVFDISMFIRTRKPTGQVFYLGSDPKKINDTNQSFVSAKLNGGELLVRLQFNGTPEEQPVGGNRLDNGNTHLLQVIRNLTLVQVKINGTEYFRKTLSSTGQLDAEVLYLGGPPPTPSPATTSSALSENDVTDVNAMMNADENDKNYFKGIIQDVRVSNGSQGMTVELFPLHEQGLILPPTFGEVIFDKNSILKGEISDDLCRLQPCQHGATCRNTWNDVQCICPRGYKGKYCEGIEFCEIQKCPGHSQCQNLDDGFECITNMTFEGKENHILSYTFYQNLPVNINASDQSTVTTTSSSAPTTTSSLSMSASSGATASGSSTYVQQQQQSQLKPIIEISYRTKTGGTLLYVQDSDMYFEIAVYKDQVTVQWRLSSELPETKRFHSASSSFGWETLYLRVDENLLEGGFKGWEDPMDPQPIITANIDEMAFLELFSGKYLIYLGGMPPIFDTNAISKNSVEGAVFKGCLGQARIGNILLPFFEHSDMFPDGVLKHSHFRLNTTAPTEGCILCFQQDCQNNGICNNPSENYACECTAGYEADDCSHNIDECLTANCTNNSTCIDLIANYRCDCLPGYEGVNCEQEIDECRSQPCHNNGICTDLLAAYLCECTEDYAGPQCDILRLVTCENLPCKNGSTCIDGFNSTTGNNFTCACHPGLLGALCDIPFCSTEPCQNGGFCLTTDPIPVCKCSLGYAGKFCEIDIDECSSQPCQNNGICTDLLGGYHCNCDATGFEGINCEIDIDECIVERISCGPRGNCINTRGSYKCKCEIGLCGPDCVLSDPCQQTTVNICQNGGECTENCSDVSDYMCLCIDGYIGRNCTEVAAIREEGISPTDIAIIVVPIVVGILLIGGIVLAAFLIMARNKRATRGTYSPSAQEYCNPRLEMDNVIKPPPEERLI